MKAKMINKFYVFLIATLITSLSCAYAADAQPKVALKTGNWTVYQDVDPMKDTVECTGIYKDNRDIQLSNDALYIKAHGGISNVKLRFDDGDATGLRDANEIEKKISYIILSGSECSTLMDSRRLRVRASALIRGLLEVDLDLSGISEAVASIRSGCKIVPNSKDQAPIKHPSCSAEVVSRMKTNGLKEKQIQAICK